MECDVRLMKNPDGKEGTRCGLVAIVKMFCTI